VRGWGLNPCENLGRRPSPRVKHFGCLSPQGEFPKCTEDDRACRKGFSLGALLSVTFLGQARKVTRENKSIWIFTRLFFWGAHRSAAQHASKRCGLITIFSFPRALSLRTCRPAFFLSDLLRTHALLRLSRQSSPAIGYGKGGSM